MVDLLVTLQLAQSKSQARRLIQQGGVRLDDDKVSDIDMIIEPQAGPHILRVGKRHFVQLLG
jgi:tyrosyl-tRNA synthetase